MTTKEELFNDLMQNYKEEIESGKFTKSLDEYIANFAVIYNKEWDKSYSPSVKKEDREPFILLSNNQEEGFFFDPELQMKVEDIKREEIASIDLSGLKQQLVTWSIDYVSIENKKVTGEVEANPMNVYGGLIYQNFIEEKLDRKQLEGYRYSPYQILNYYLSESEGYKKIVSEIMKDYFILLIKKKNQDIKDIHVWVETKNNNQYVLHAQKSGKHKEIVLVCKFMDGYYNFWNDNDERNVSVFNIDMIFPDYASYL